VRIYFIATQYKNKILDISWNPLAFDEANKKLEELAARAKELASRNQANNISYHLISLTKIASTDADGKITRE